MKNQIERSYPQLLYKTGLSTFDLRKHPNIKTYMIRDSKTKKVILPDPLLTSTVIDDLKACPNLEEVYFSAKTYLEPYKKIKAQKLTYKDLP